ncbi:MAG: hypothetical protein KatS3mg105_1790 [Gemmatales bacterium]|nr:MAG: hypothetical protein KatS3mg105_1790 [Gemmatales bacterium]
MSMNLRFLTVIAACLALTWGLSLAADSEKADAATIKKLIEQLGSESFAERQAAAEKLEKIGVPALEALRKAVEHPDIEVKRRATELVAKIEKHVERDRILAPTFVHLVCKDLPVADAVAQLAKQSGYAIELQGNSDMRVTLDTGKTTFWQAFDHLCRAGKLVEVDHAGQNPNVPQPRNPKLRGRAIRPAVQNMPTVQQKIVLKPGQPVDVPTFYRGALRIQALPDKDKAANELGFVLDMRPEPKIPWWNLKQVELGKVVDDQAQALVRQIVDNPNGGGNGAKQQVIINGVPVPLPVAGGAVAKAPIRKQPVRFEPGDKQSNTLTEVKGTLRAEVQTPPKPLITVENIMQAVGKTIKGKDGGSITIHEAKMENGQFRLRFGLDVPPNANAMIPPGAGAAIAIAVAGGNIAVRPNIGMNNAKSDLKVLDKNGNELAPQQVSSRMQVANNQVSWEYTWRFPANNQPAKMVYMGSSTLEFDIPFELKNVPIK